MEYIGYQEIELYIKFD